MPIILRLNKGSELTFAELDGNFTDLDDRVDTIEALNLGSRVTRLEQAGTPIYFDSDDVMVMLDSIWAGGVDSFLATTDSIGLASFDSSRFSVTNGHVSWIERLATIDSDGTASFDSQDFVVTNGHVTINPNSPGGRVAGITPIDSTGVASFADADFNVTTNGHVSLTDSAVRTRVSAVDASGDGSFVYDQTTGEFTYTGPSASEVRAHFSAGTGISITNGVIATTGGSGIPVSSGINVVGSIMFLQTSGMSNGQVYAPGDSVPGSKLVYGNNKNNTGSFGFRKELGSNVSTQGSVYVGVATFPGYNSSNGTAAGVSGTWRNLGPGVVGYKSGWFTSGNTGSTGYGLFQRIS
tara:strand:+ start:1880 stop:2935 length:1056 start_codon:yes stop_codon:yes gene_type:complete